MAAHPRSRGENRVGARARVFPPGSSPLTRGKRGRSSPRRPRRRLIPAHAGKTSMSITNTRRGRAHPRSRGENPGRQEDPGAHIGSSPLTRGKPQQAESQASRRGLIPAHAGKTATGCEFVERVMAHPRSRGENLKPFPPAPERAGSSPLTRGKPGQHPLAKRPPRLIPAHAGKTSTVTRSLASRAAHPRSRGENESFATVDVLSVGSSPLTRGKRACGDAALHEVRLIPAHAGKTRDSTCGRGVDPAHPRSRGENPS